jgi:hypothetical protein
MHATDLAKEAVLEGFTLLARFPLLFGFVKEAARHRVNAPALSRVVARQAVEAVDECHPGNLVSVQKRDHSQVRSVGVRSHR